MIKDELNVAEKTPIEIALQIDNDGYTTASKLYSFLELSPSNYSKWCKTNIAENEFAEENVDFVRFVVKYESGVGIKEREDYKITAHFAKKLSMKSQGERAEQAREYFTKVEETVKETAVNRSNLSPSLQMFYAIADSQAKIELEQKKQAAQIAQVESKVNTMQEIFIRPIENWQTEINRMVREISAKSKIPYQELWAKLYGELETTAKCSLKRLCENKKKRMENTGNTKAAIKSKTTKLAVIQDNKRLKSIFENIVKRYAMAYLPEKSVIA